MKIQGSMPVADMKGEEGMLGNLYDRDWCGA